MLHPGAVVFWALVVHAGPPGAAPPAKEPAPAPAVERVMTESDPDATPTNPDEADVAVRGSFTAEQIQWHVVPQVRVRLYGSRGTQTEWTSSRQNLPRQVEAGRTYRNVGGRVQITSRLGAETQVTTSTWSTESAAPPRPPPARRPPPPVRQPPSRPAAAPPQHSAWAQRAAPAQPAQPAPPPAAQAEREAVLQQAVSPPAAAVTSGER